MTGRKLARSSLAWTAGIAALGLAWMLAGGPEAQASGPDPAARPEAAGWTLGQAGTPPAGGQARPGGEGQRGAGPPRPGGLRWEWWKDQEVKKELALTEDRARKIDNLYQQRLRALQPFADEYEKQIAELDRLTRERLVDEASYAVQVARVEGLRSKLSESRAVMLYRIYLELSPEQYRKLRDIRDRRGRGRSGGLPR